MELLSIASNPNSISKPNEEKMRIFLLLVSLILPFNAKALEVVTSFSILADMVKEVGGDKVNIKNLVGPNGDAHVYQPTPNDAKLIANSGLLVINGLGFEGWMSRLIKSSGYKGLVITASKGIKPLPLENSHHKHGYKHQDDPHAWQNLPNAKQYVLNIMAGLSLADPANADFYKRNGQRYIEQIMSLDAEIRAKIAEIPSQNRKLVTSHDAFAYFAISYRIEFHSPTGLSTEAEASAHNVAKLITLIRKEKIRAVFVENISDPRLLEQILKESGAQIGGSLFSDALSNPQGPAPTYLQMIRHNVTTLVEALR